MTKTEAIAYISKLSYKEKMIINDWLSILEQTNRPSEAHREKDCTDDR